MRTDKPRLIKGLKYLAYTVALMFTAPLVLFQAFKNQEHAFFVPVFILGLILAVAAISLGFISIKTIVDAFFGKRK